MGDKDVTYLIANYLFKEVRNGLYVYEKQPATKEVYEELFESVKQEIMTQDYAGEYIKGIFLMQVSGMFKIEVDTIDIKVYTTEGEEVTNFSWSVEG